MTSRRRGERLCGIGAFVWGLLALALAYFPSYAQSSATNPNVVIVVHPGFTANEIPYILAIGLPILGITIGAVAHSLIDSKSMRLVLWIATALMGVEALLGAISALAGIVVPAFLLGLGASLLARNPQHDVPDAERRAA